MVLSKQFVLTALAMIMAALIKRLCIQAFFESSISIAVSIASLDGRKIIPGDLRSQKR